MNRDLILALGTIIAGGMLSAYAWTIPALQPFTTICIILGLVLCVVGFISFVLILKRKQ